MTTETTTETKYDLDFPNLWGVRFLNDDYTPMEFVIAVLYQIFRLDVTEAEHITQLVHDTGQATVGQYTREIAEAKAEQALRLASISGHPLAVEPVTI